MLLTAGERISMALLSMAVEDLGQPAVSFTGSQAGIVTDTEHGKAKIIEVEGDRIREALAEGKVAIVAGLPGRVDRARDHHAGPRRVRPHRGRARGRARRRRVRDLHRRRRRVHRRPAHRARPRASSPASRSTRCSRWRRPAGACSRCARSSSRATTDVQVHVRSSFTWAPGTWVTEEDEAMDAIEAMEQAIISGVTHDTSEAKVTIEQVPDRPGVAATIFRALAEAGVNVDMIVQNVSTAGHTDISFTVPRADVERAASVHGEDRRRDRGERLRHRRAHRPGLAHRRGHEDASRHRRQDVRDARRARASTSR